MIRALHDGDACRPPWAPPPYAPGLGRAHGADPLPAGFVALSERLPPGLDRRLGYVGDERFVIFYYEPRGEEVVWDDGHTYGFGAGGWCAFEDVVAPLGRRYGADLGNEVSAGRDVLVLDRLRGMAYFAERGCARRFVGGLTTAGVGTAIAPGLVGTDVDVAVDVAVNGVAAGGVAVGVFGRLDVDRSCS